MNDGALNELDKRPGPREVTIVWEKRAVLLTAFGVVGFGTLVGAAVAFTGYLRKKLEDHFRLDSSTAAQDAAQGQQGKEGTGPKGTVGPPGAPSRPKGRGRRWKKKIRSRSVTHVRPKGIKALKRRTRSLQHLKGKGKAGHLSDILSSSLSDIMPEEDSQQYPVDEFFEKIDKLLAGYDNEQHEAYILLKTNTEKLAHLSEYWWRLAEASHLEGILAGIQQDKESQKTLVLDALAYAKKSLKIDESSADAHKWYAVTLGNTGEYLSINEKIQNGYTFKEHIDKALAISPTDPVLHYLLGRFSFEVSQLSWMERRVAAALFSAPPTATIQEAINHFLEADKLGNPTIDNRLFLGKCYIALGDYKKAVHWLQEASKLPFFNSSHRKSRMQVLELLTKYQKYGQSS